MIELIQIIGIITFHSAYNYGSVLQAFATQTFIKKLGSENEIINYRLDEQRRVYSNLRFNYGYKEFIKDLSLLPIYGRRNIRKEKFETFLFAERQKTLEKYGINIRLL